MKKKEGGGKKQAKKLKTRETRDRDANSSEGRTNARGRGAAAEVMELFKASRSMAVILLHSLPPRALKPGVDSMSVTAHKPRPLLLPQTEWKRDANLARTRSPRKPRWCRFHLRRKRETREVNTPWLPKYWHPWQEQISRSGQDYFNRGVTT